MAFAKIPSVSDNPKTRQKLSGTLRCCENLFHHSLNLYDLVKFSQRHTNLNKVRTTLYDEEKLWSSYCKRWLLETKGLALQFLFDTEIMNASRGNSSHFGCHRKIVLAPKWRRGAVAASLGESPCATFLFDNSSQCGFFSLDRCRTHHDFALLLEHR